MTVDGDQAAASKDPNQDISYDRRRHGRAPHGTVDAADRLVALRVMGFNAVTANG